MQEIWQPTLGAVYLGEGRCRFRLWAPLVEQVEVELCDGRRASLEPKDDGYYEGVLDGVEPGTRYFYSLDGEEGLPDPASRFQPEGVHGPSQVVEIRPAVPVALSGWSGMPLEDYILYELHVGTFTAEGTFDAVIPHLDDLRDLGITAIEIMPVAQFPGSRNWGYDGVQPFAVQNTYGGPEGLTRLVDACHERGLAVVLDVVYNHLGPEGNYFSELGPYFTARYKTPWGLALNFDGPDSDPVRAFFIENALHWVAEHGIDALRLDAVHAIADASERPFLQELGTALHTLGDRLGRKIYGIAESDLNTLFFLRSPDRGGCGLDTQWTDDFHHSLHTLLTGERSGYYQDFGCLSHMAKAMAGGFVYTGQPSPYRRRRHGVPAEELDASRHVVCSQNHDQTGNRMRGERLTSLVSFESLKLAAGAILLSPFLPLLFMGEEYGEPAPFRYFVSHSDEDLIEAVRKGRAEEFASFGWHEDPPDPQGEETFQLSRLDRTLRDREPHRTLEAFYRELIRLRKSLPALRNLSKDRVTVTAREEKGVLLVHRRADGHEAVVALNFSPEGEAASLDLPEGAWRKLLDSSEECWGGKEGSGEDTPPRLAGRAVALFERV